MNTHTNPDVTASAKSVRPFTFDIRLNGFIEALAPITISSADTAGTPDAGVTFVPIMVNGSPIRTPIIRGENTKGSLRRAAVRVAGDILKRRAESTDQPFLIKQYYRNAVGGVKGKGAQRPDDIFQVAITTKRNTIAKLFGLAEPYWVTGDLEVGQAVAQQPDCVARIVGGARIDDLLRDAALTESFSPEEKEEWSKYNDHNKLASKLKIEGEKIVKQKKAAEKAAKAAGGKLEPSEVARFDELIKEIATKVDTIKAGTFVSETIARPLPMRSAIMMGTKLDHHMAANRLAPEQLGFLLATLEAWIDNGIIGGGKNVGYGRYKAEYQLKLRTNDGLSVTKWQDAGRIVLDEDGMRIEGDASPMVDTALTAFQTLASDPDVDFGFEEASKAIATEYVQDSE